jgi:radical SAM-linked protein
MKVRIKFQKFGAMKFIGHLDVMRYFQKAFRRAGMDNEYTKGFNPHQIMSFAAPLGVGLTSDGEYVDVQLLSSDSPEVMMDRLNAVMSEGFRIIGFRFLKEREDNRKNVTAMAQVSTADYLVSLKDGYGLPEVLNSPAKFRRAFEEFHTGDEIVIDKKTKTKEKAVNIKPMIYFIAFEQEEYIELKKKTLKDTASDRAIDPVSEEAFASVKENNLPGQHGSGIYQENIPESVADVYENGIKVYLQLDTGSAANLKPELVMEAFLNKLGLEYQGFAWQVHRLEVYSREEDSRKLIPLDMLER